MTTEELCEELKRRFNGWTDYGTNGVLNYLNQANKILMSQACAHMLVVDATTGLLPVFPTTAGQFRYPFATDVWRVANVYIRKTTVDYGETRYSNMANVMIFGGKKYLRYPYVTFYDFISTSSPAAVVFSQDPTTTTDKFYAEPYRRPTDILSLNIQHDVPSPYDIEYLLLAAISLIEGVRGGAMIESYKFVAEMKKRLAVALNQNAHSEGSVRREF